MEILFLFSFFLVFYIYLGYPVLMRMLSFNKKTIDLNDNYLPSVSILISAYNEEEHIGNTIINKLELCYPKEKLEIIVVSDGSEDKTDEIVKRISREYDGNVKLIRQYPRAGKTSGLNLLVPEAQGEIIVFSDANSIYEKDAIKKLVRNFADYRIGYVTGKMIYINKNGSLVGDGCSGYMKFENWLRQQETNFGSIIGVDGGIDAMRKSLYEPLKSDQLPDFVQPLKVVEKGYRVVYEPEALLKEEALDDHEREYSMRVRVTLRAIWALHDMRQLLNPMKYRMFSIQIISHKLLRYLAFIPLFICFVSNWFLISYGYIYVISLLLQMVFYMLSWKGRQYKYNKNLPLFYSIPYYFNLINMACAHATWRYLKGEKQAIWKPRSG